MHYSPATRALALIAGLLVTATAPALAQDTTDMGGAPMDSVAPQAGAIDTAGVDSAAADTADTSATDTSAVRDPAGYRGMERDTTMFPDSGSPTGAEEHPAGHSGTTDSAAGQDSTTVGDTEPVEHQSAEPRIETPAPQ